MECGRKYSMLLPCPTLHNRDLRMAPSFGLIVSSFVKRQQSGGATKLYSPGPRWIYSYPYIYDGLTRGRSQPQLKSLVW